MSVNIVNKSTGALTKIAGNPVEQASGISYDHTSSGMSATDVQGAVDELNSNLSQLVSLGAYVYGTKTIVLASEATGTVQFTLSDFVIPSGYNANLANVNVTVIGNWGISPENVELSFDGGDTAMQNGLNVEIKGGLSGGNVSYRVNVLLGIYKS